MATYKILASVRVIALAVREIEADSEEEARRIADEEDEAGWESQIWQESDWEVDWTNAENFRIDEITKDEKTLVLY